MLVVVSDTSPLRCLHCLHLLHLLGRLFDETLIPPAVVVELRRGRGGDIANDILALPLLRVLAPTDPATVARFRRTLDAGESEAIALALEIHASLVLVDEKDGRVAATRAGLETMGVLGLLARAKVRGLVPALAPLIDRLRNEGNFFVSPQVRADALRAAGE